jgi:hypothetical protein
MPEYPPFMNSYGLVTKIFEKIKEAKTPERFTQDFLADTLGFSGGSARPFIPLLKRLDFLSTEGVPTERYQQFRNPNHSKGAMGSAIRHGYAELYSRNENAHGLDGAALKGLVVQATGLDNDSRTLRAIVSTFSNLRAFADFEGQAPAAKTRAIPEKEAPGRRDGELAADPSEIRLGLSYTINLVLPRTDDVAVFNAIFRALREQLLRK